MSRHPPPHLIKGSLASGEGVLLLGLFRSGTKSLHRAMHILGYEHVHHASEDHDDDSWDRIAEAAHATFPILSRSEGKPKPQDFEKAEWDRVFGEYQAVSDAASVFAPELITAYPAAKVILVQRDFDSWLASADTVFISSVLDPRRKLLYDLVVRPVRKLHFYVGLRSVCMGLFGATTAKGARRRARKVWEVHHETVRRMVPNERLLDFRPGEELSWERLCAFLGKEVPVGVDFPRVNSREAWVGETAQTEDRIVSGCLVAWAWYLFPILMFCSGYCVARLM
ncbi:hypothetical protein SLS64_013735 [Diaporthe eres]|uniref:NAD dependent epimerase/dehydratase n=1 Tax=Diaporthe eres TaxID=83184 RepID=A0ABR1NM61_DIAER